MDAQKDHKIFSWKTINIISAVDRRATQYGVNEYFYSDPRSKTNLFVVKYEHINEPQESSVTKR